MLKGNRQQLLCRSEKSKEERGKVGLEEKLV